MHVVLSDRFFVYILSRKLQYQSADSAQTDRANGNVVLVFHLAMKGARKSLKVIKTLFMLRQVVMNFEMMEFPFPSSGIFYFNLDSSNSISWVRNSLNLLQNCK